MALFENKKIIGMAKELDVTKAELSSFITKSNDNIKTLEGMLSREHGSSATYHSLLRDFSRIGDPYMNNIFVRKAIDKTAGMIAGVNVIVTDTKDVELGENNPATKLFSYINDEDSSFDFFYEIVRSLTRYGKAFILKSEQTRVGAKIPQTLEILNATEMKPKTKNGMLQHWEFGKNKVKFQPEDVMFIKHKHPDNPYDGLAPGSSATKEILQDFYANVYNIKNFQNGAMGAGAWVDPNGSNLTPQQKQEAQFAVDNEFNRGVDGANKSVVLSRKLEWIRTSESNKDLDYIALLNKMRDDILVAYDIPKVLFTSADATFTNLKEAKKLFWSQTLLPIIKKIEDSFNTNFFEPMGLPYLLKFDISTVNELQDDLATKMTTAAQMNAMNIPMSIINEVLSLGLPETGWDGWDTPAQTGFQFDSKIPETKNAEQIIKEYKKQTAYDIEKSLQHDDFLLQKEYKNSLDCMLSRERELSNTVKAFYSMTYKEKIEPWLKRAGIDKSTVKVDKGAASDFITYLKGLDLRIPFFEYVKASIEKTFQQGVFRTYSGIGADFSLTSDRAISYMAQRGLKLKDSPEVVKQTIITMMESDSFTIDDMAKEISKGWKGASEARAKIIAITETTSAYSSGRITGMKELGIKKCKWVHSHDVKVRDSHRISETIDVDTKFTLADGYQVAYPGDGNAEHSIGCRCVVISVLD